MLKLVKIKPKKITLFIAEKWKYDLFKILKKELKNERNFGKLMGKVMKNNEFKKHSKDIAKIIQRTLKHGIDDITSQEKEYTILKESRDFFGKEFKTEIEVIKAEDSKKNKANSALPGKVAILIE